MPEYIYRDFLVSYEVTLKKNSHDLYQAMGTVKVLADLNVPNQQVNFSTEYQTVSGVQNEIKKIMENYIDFEWEQSARLKSK